MVAYRAYALDPHGHITKRFEFEAADDVAALAHARQWVDGCDVEVWQLARVVATLTHGKPPRVIWPPMKKRNNDDAEAG